MPAEETCQSIASPYGFGIACRRGRRRLSTAFAAFRSRLANADYAVLPPTRTATYVKRRSSLRSRARRTEHSGRSPARRSTPAARAASWPVAPNLTLRPQPGRSGGPLAEASYISALRAGFIIANRDHPLSRAQETQTAGSAESEPASSTSSDLTELAGRPDRADDRHRAGESQTRTAEPRLHICRW